MLADLEKEIANLRMLCDGKVKGFAESANKWLKIDYEHILGIDLSFSKKGIPQIKGFHHDFMQTIEKNHLFKFTEKIVYKSGFYSATLCYGENFVKNITFFPSHWSRKQVVNKIYEAYNNFINNGIKPILEANGKYKIDAPIDEKLMIRMYITKDGTIKTAYPILK